MVVLLVPSTLPGQGLEYCSTYATGWYLNVLDAVKVDVASVTHPAPGCSVTPVFCVKPARDGDVGPAGPAVFHEILVAVLPHLALAVTTRTAPPFLALQA